MVFPLHGGDLAALVEVGREAESSLGVLDDPDDLAPSPQRLVRRVLGLHAPEVLLEVALHHPLPDSPLLPPTPSAGGERVAQAVYIHADRTRSAAWAPAVDARGRDDDAWRGQAHCREVASCAPARGGAE